MFFWTFKFSQVNVQTIWKQLTIIFGQERKMDVIAEIIIGEYSDYPHHTLVPKNLFQNQSFTMTMLVIQLKRVMVVYQFNLSHQRT